MDWQSRSLLCPYRNGCQNHWYSASHRQRMTLNFLGFQSRSTWTHLVTKWVCMQSRGTIQCSFALACADNHSVKTVVIDHQEVQPCLESHWTECIPPIEIPLVLCMKAWLVNGTLCASHLFWASHCFQLFGLCRSQPSAY